MVVVVCVCAVVGMTRRSGAALRWHLLMVCLGLGVYPPEAHVDLMK